MKLPPIALKLPLTVTLSVFVVAAWTSACSSDDSGAGGSSGSGGSAGSSGSGGLAPGECNGQETALGAEYDATASDGGAVKKGIFDISKDCGVSCVAQNVSEQCVNDCIQGVVKGAITEQCTFCNAQSVKCGATHCLSVCIGPDAAACNACICGGNAAKFDCIKTFETCSGIDDTTTCSS